MRYRNNLFKVEDFVRDQMLQAGMTLADLEASGLLQKAGCDMEDGWIRMLLEGRAKRVKMLQLLGLRRLFQEPADIILGYTYNPENSHRMAGLKRIRYELGVSAAKRQKDVYGRIGVSQQMIARVENYAIGAIKHKIVDLNTPLEKVYNFIFSVDTFSIDLLIAIRNLLDVNIDDILGYGQYDSTCPCDIDFIGGEKKHAIYGENQLAMLSPAQRKHPEQVLSPMTEDPYRYETDHERKQREHKEEVERITREIQEESIRLGFTGPMSDSQPRKPESEMTEEEKLSLMTLSEEMEYLSTHPELREKRRPKFVTRG